VCFVRGFESFLFGKNFFSERVNDWAFSKFCRLIVSINFGFARLRRYKRITPQPLSMARGWGVLCCQTAQLPLNLPQGVNVAGGLASGDGLPFLVTPYHVRGLPDAGVPVGLHQSVALTFNRLHGSVLVGEQGQACQRLISELRGMGTCQPGCLHSDGHLQPHGLLCALSGATCPHDGAGGEVGCHGHDHDKGSEGVGGGGGGVSATIPAGGLPTVALSTAAVVGVCIHQVVMLGQHPPIGEGLVLTSLEVVAGLVVHVVSLQGRDAQRHSVWDTSHIVTARRSACALVICRPADRALPPTQRVRARADRGRMRRDMV